MNEEEEQLVAGEGECGGRRQKREVFQRTRTGDNAPVTATVSNILRGFRENKRAASRSPPAAIFA